MKITHMKWLMISLFIVIIALTEFQAWPLTARAAPDPIYHNGVNTFYSDHLVSTDAYKATYRSTDGQVLTKDGDSSWTWDKSRNDKLYLQTPYPILDAAYSLAVREALDNIKPAGTTSAQLAGDSPGGQYYYPYYSLSHGSDIREYTRDTAQHVNLGDSVILDSNTAKGTMLRRLDFTKKLIREDAVPTADSLHLIVAAWEYYKITGDEGFLKLTWETLWNTIHVKETQLKDTSDGLWIGATWSDNVSGYVQANHFANRNKQVESLYANTVVAGAWQSLGNIATQLGEKAAASECKSKYNALKTAINTLLYRPSFGTYAYYRYNVDNTYYNYREDITAGMIYLYGIADANQTLTYHNKFVATNYGYRNVDPVLPSGESSYHGGNVWEDEDAFHGWALARLKRADDLKNFLFWHARQGIVTKQYREGTINPSTGALHNNYAHMIWSEIGNMSYWSRGVFGIGYEQDGLHFAPVIPSSFGNNFYAILNNFTYRDSNLRLSVVGQGTTVDHFTLDGSAFNGVVPTNLVGNHEVKIYMSSNTNPAIPESRDRYEGEKASTNATVSAKPTASDGHYVGGLDKVGQYVSFTVNVLAAKTYQVSVGYANGNGKVSAATRGFYVNNTLIQNISYPVIGGWTNFVNHAPISVELNAGVNTIKIQTDSSDVQTIDVDYINVIDTH